MDDTASHIREYDMEVGQCLLIGQRNGPAVILALRAVGRDLEGDCVAEWELHTEDDSELMVGLSRYGTTFVSSEYRVTTAEAPALDRTVSGDTECRGLPRFWYLCRYLVGHETRNDVFLPAFNQLLEDYYVSRLKHRVGYDRIFLSGLFSFRTATMILQCIHAEVKERRLPVRAIFASAAVVKVIHWLTGS